MEQILDKKIAEFPDTEYVKHIRKMDFNIQISNDLWNIIIRHIVKINGDILATHDHITYDISEYINDISGDENGLVSMRLVDIVISHLEQIILSSHDRCVTKFIKLIQIYLVDDLKNVSLSHQ